MIVRHIERAPEQALPLPTRRLPPDKVGSVTARALRLALWPARWDTETASRELWALAEGDPDVLAAALARVEHGEAPGDVAGATERAAETLRTARCARR